MVDKNVLFMHNVGAVQHLIGQMATVRARRACLVRHRRRGVGHTSTKALRIYCITVGSGHMYAYIIKQRKGTTICFRNTCASGGVFQVDALVAALAAQEDQAADAIARLEVYTRRLEEKAHRHSHQAYPRTAIQSLIPCITRQTSNSPPHTCTPIVLY